MTNHFTDMRNSDLFMVFSNPAESHSIAVRNMEEAMRKRGAKVVVIEPRRTRTAAIAEHYIRIRPGTDIAFMNGVMKKAFDRMDAGTMSKTYHEAYTVCAKDQNIGQDKDYWYAFDTDDGAGNEWPTDGAFGTAGTDWMAWPKHTDARFIIRADGQDYVRYGIDSDATAAPYLASSNIHPRDFNAGFWAGNGAANDDSRADTLNIPIMSDTLDWEGSGNQAGEMTVFTYMKKRVQSYTVNEVCKIVGCDADLYNTVTDMMLDRSYAGSEVAAVAGETSGWWNSGTAFGVGDFDADGTPPDFDSGYKKGSILYAMGTTQHSCGAQNVRSYAMFQLLVGNMGKPGGGVNALRGCANVQGSTDMALLAHIIPQYGGIPAPVTTNHLLLQGSFDTYVDPLFGNSAQSGLFQKPFKHMTRLWYGGADGEGVCPVDGAATPDGIPSEESLFGWYPTAVTAAGTGYKHYDMFKKVLTGDMKAIFSWGEDPVVSCPNALMIRDAIKALDTYVCVDLFLHESALAERKSGSFTYFLPTCGVIEKPGSRSNSGRWIQWGYAAHDPENWSQDNGGSKSDFEIMLKMAETFHKADVLCRCGFANGTTAYQKIWRDHYLTDAVYDSGTGYRDAWDWDNNEFCADMAHDGYSGYCEWCYREMNARADFDWRTDAAPVGTEPGGTMWLQVGWSGKQGGWDPAINGGAEIPYTEVTRYGSHGIDANILAGTTKNVSQWRNQSDPSGMGVYPKFSHVWLYNRRAFYNRGSVNTGGNNYDVYDAFVEPDRVANLFANKKGSSPKPVLYTQTWRFYHTLVDFPDTRGPVSPYGGTPQHTEPWESPSPVLVAQYGNIGVGPNSTADPNGGGPDGYYNFADTDVERGEFPLVLTTMRHTEHFQSGPLTRNVPWLNELIPNAVVQISAADAAGLGIDPTDLDNDANWVGIMTLRTARNNKLNGATSITDTTITVDSTADFKSGDDIIVGADEANPEKRTNITVVNATQISFAGGLVSVHADNAYVVNTSRQYVGPWKPEIGAGPVATQKTGGGVVAVPWCWGDAGLAKGPTANELCINAFDANTHMPESKACLCKIIKWSNRPS